MRRGPPLAGAWVCGAGPIVSESRRRPGTLVCCAACALVLAAALLAYGAVLVPIALAPLTTLSSNDCDAACARARLVADARARVVRTCSLPPRFSSDRYGEGVRWRNVTDAAAAAQGWVVERVGDGPGGSDAGCARALSPSDARKVLAGQHVLFFGDSVSRQHFYSVAHFLDHGAWVVPLDTATVRIAGGNVRAQRALRQDPLSLRAWRTWFQVEHAVEPSLIVEPLDELTPNGTADFPGWLRSKCRYWVSTHCDPGTRASFVFWKWHKNVTIQSPRSLGVEECIAKPFARARAGERADCSRRTSCAAGFASSPYAPLRTQFSSSADEALAYALDTLNPDVVVLNSGLHDGPNAAGGADDAAATLRIASVLCDAAARRRAEHPPRRLRIVWRTTTRSRSAPLDGVPPSTQADAVADLEAAGAEVLDGWSLTEGLVPASDANSSLSFSAYYDRMHFSSSVVGELGAALIALLAGERDPPLHACAPRNLRPSPSSHPRARASCALGDFLHDWDAPGASSELRGLSADSPDACCGACVRDAACAAWVWRGGGCWLKASARSLQRGAVGLVAGYVRDPAAERGAA